MADIPQNQIDQIKPDALTPAQIAARAVSVGETKARMPFPRAFTLAMLAGVFIGFGASFMLVVKGDSSLPFAASQVLGGFAFSFGLFMVVTAGAELFTGNSLMIIGRAEGKYTTADLLRSWLVVYLGNLVGSILLALLMHFANFRGMGGGAVGTAIVSVALGKVTPAADVLFFRGVLCNMLVCLAVWMSFATRSVIDKVFVCVLPVMAFVACGFEHSIANMFFLPLGLLTKGALGAEALAAISGVEALTLAGVVRNIAIVTAGNLVGGVILIGCAYWFAYLRKD